MRIPTTLLAVLIFLAGGMAAPAQTRVTYVMPGDPTRLNDEIVAAVNRKLAADTGLQVATRFVPWDSWENKINLMLASAESFDLFHVMQDLVPYTSYYAKGGLADLTDAIRDYGTNLAKYIPDEIWSGAKVKGRTFVIPAFWIELGNEGRFEIRLDLLAENGLSIPRTPAELLSAMEVVSRNWKGQGKPYLPLTPSATNGDPIGMHSSVLHRSYPSFPFTVKEKLFWVSQSGQVKSWVETPEFKKDASWFRGAYSRGLIDPDVLTVKQETFTNQRESGNWLVTFGTLANLKPLLRYWPSITDRDIASVAFNPEKVTLRPFGIKNSNAVPSSSRNVSLGVRFLDWLYNGQENYDLWMYGIEGKTYTRVGDRKRDSVFDDTSRPLYEQADWMMGNLHFLRTESAMPTATFRYLYVLDPSAVNSPAADFFFDATDVRAGLSNVMSAFSASMLPVYMGVVDWDRNYAPALEKMKKAGLDKVVAAYRTQLAAFMAGHR